jgi:hypothetical protein
MYFSGWSNCLIFPHICAIFLNLDQLSNLNCAHPCFVFSLFSWRVSKLVSGHPKVPYPTWFQVIPKYPPRPLSVEEKCSCLLLFVTKRKNGRSPVDIYTTRLCDNKNLKNFPKTLAKLVKFTLRKYKNFQMFCWFYFWSQKKTRTHYLLVQMAVILRFLMQLTLWFKNKEWIGVPLDNIFTRFLIFILDNLGLK